jgi:hypothetical protein
MRIAVIPAEGQSVKNPSEAQKAALTHPFTLAGTPAVVPDEQYLAFSFEQSEIAPSPLVHAIAIWDGLHRRVNHRWAYLQLFDLPGSQ